MSGLLSEEEAGRTDLGMLEKRLAEKATSVNTQPQSLRDSPKAAASTGSSSAPIAESQGDTPSKDNYTSPQDSITSPGTEGDSQKQPEAENLSELMCSLVTNNSGETRYIGKHFYQPSPSRFTLNC